MKKKTWKGFLLIIVVLVLAIVYQNVKKDGAANCVATLQELVDGGTYAVEVMDSNGESHVVEESRKEQLAQLIVQTVQEAEQIPDMTDIPSLSVRIFGGEPVKEAVLTIYDQKEETNFGTLLWKERTYSVQNCGEVYNYLAELGMYTER